MRHAHDEPPCIEVERRRHGVHARWIIEGPAREGDPCELTMIVIADGSTRLSSQNCLADVITPDAWLSLLAAESAPESAPSAFRRYHMRSCRISHGGGVANVYATERDGDDGLLMVIQRNDSDGVDVHRLIIDRETAINRNAGLRFFHRTHGSDAMCLMQSMGGHRIKDATPSLLGLTPGARAVRRDGADEYDYRTSAWIADREPRPKPEPKPKPEPVAAGRVYDHPRPPMYDYPRRPRGRARKHRAPTDSPPKRIGRPPKKRIAAAADIATESAAIDAEMSRKDLARIPAIGETWVRHAWQLDPDTDDIVKKFSCYPVRIVEIDGVTVLWRDPDGAQLRQSRDIFVERNQFTADLPDMEWLPVPSTDHEYVAADGAELFYDGKRRVFRPGTRFAVVGVDDFGRVQCRPVHESRDFFTLSARMFADLFTPRDT